MGGGREFKIQCDVITYYVQLLFLFLLLLLLPLSAEFYGPRLNALKMKLKSKKRAKKEGRDTQNLVTFVWDFWDVFFPIFFFIFFSMAAGWFIWFAVNIKAICGIISYCNQRDAPVMFTHHQPNNVSKVVVISVWSTFL